MTTRHSSLSGLSGDRTIISKRCINQLWIRVNQSKVMERSFCLFSISNERMDNQFKPTMANGRNKLMLCNDLPTQLHSRPNSTRSRGRRRRRSSAAPQESSAETDQQNIIKDLSTFLSASDSFLSHIEKGLEPMKPVN